VCNSCGGLGVFFLTQEQVKRGSKTWKTTKGGALLMDNIEEGSDLKIGGLLKFEPWVEELTKAEWRHFSYLQNHSIEKGLSNIYGVQTKYDTTNGKITINNFPNDYLTGHRKVLTKNIRDQMKRLFKSAIEQLM
jgi:hypothetical protein